MLAEDAAEWNFARRRNR